MGGSFDPPHLGHAFLAATARESLGLDRVIFLPCRISPHKLEHPPTAPEHRLEMLRLALADLPWAALDLFDLEAPPPSYSVRTAEHFRDLHPDAELFWILGHDQWEALPRWHRPERLAELLHFVVFARGSRPAPRPGWKMTHLPGVHPASSTALRRQLAAGGPAEPWLHPDVLDYIRRHRLYIR